MPATAAAGSGPGRVVQQPQGGTANAARTAQGRASAQARPAP